MYDEELGGGTGELFFGNGAGSDSSPILSDKPTSRNSNKVPEVKASAIP